MLPKIIFQESSIYSPKCCLLHAVKLMADIKKASWIFFRYQKPPEYTTINRPVFFLDPQCQNRRQWRLVILFSDYWEDLFHLLYALTNLDNLRKCFNLMEPTNQPKQLNHNKHICGEACCLKTNKLGIFAFKPINNAQYLQIQARTLPKQISLHSRLM